MKKSDSQQSERKFEIRLTTQAKKDVKRFAKNEAKLTLFREYLKYLENDVPLPISSRPHMLKGQYNDCMECHMLNDFLLIWKDPDNMIIKIIRIGSHSELFDM